MCSIALAHFERFEAKQANKQKVSQEFKPPKIKYNVKNEHLCIILSNRDHYFTYKVHCLLVIRMNTF